VLVATGFPQAQMGLLARQVDADRTVRMGVLRHQLQFSRRPSPGALSLMPADSRAATVAGAATVDRAGRAPKARLLYRACLTAVLAQVVAAMADVEEMLVRAVMQAAAGTLET
jgi:hypothetical protein